MNHKTYNFRVGELIHCTLNNKVYEVALIEDFGDFCLVVTKCRKIFEAGFCERLKDKSLEDFL